jgi:hypothetical protein
MVRAGVPKAAVNEDGNALFGEYQIRAAKKGPSTSPAGDFGLPQQRDKADLGRTIAF